MWVHFGLLYSGLLQRPLSGLFILSHIHHGCVDESLKILKLKKKIEVKPTFAWMFHWMSERVTLFLFIQVISWNTNDKSHCSIVTTTGYVYLNVVFSKIMLPVGSGGECKSKTDFTSNRGVNRGGSGSCTDFVHLHSFVLKLVLLLYILYWDSRWSRG